MPNQVGVYIQTDDRGEFTCSHGFRQIANNHGYDIPTIAVDASHQNNNVERSYQMSKERICYMLSTVCLGVEFWSDALLHATWLYNQTYHSAVKMTIFEAFTSHVPTFDSLITFGTKITVKKPGDCPTPLHPWMYNIFS